LLRRFERIDIHLMPPFEFVAALVEFTMVRTTERHGELVVYLAPERALLRKLKMVRIRWAAPASHTGLGAHKKLQMIPVAQPERFVERGDGLSSG